MEGIRKKRLVFRIKRIDRNGAIAPRSLAEDCLLEVIVYKSAAKSRRGEAMPIIHTTIARLNPIQADDSSVAS